MRYSDKLILLYNRNICIFISALYIMYISDTCKMVQWISDIVAMLRGKTASTENISQVSDTNPVGTSSSGTSPTVTDSHSVSKTGDSPQNCLGCKVVSIFTLTGASVYVLHTAWNMKNQSRYARFAQRASAVGLTSGKCPHGSLCEHF